LFGHPFLHLGVITNTPSSIHPPIHAGTACTLNPAQNSENYPPHQAVTGFVVQ
jgi:hypothetical protein